MPVGKIQPYDSSESFENYVERLGFYFDANNVGDAQKKSSFLGNCGAKVYGDLKNLCYPDKPDDYSYRQIIKKLNDHYKPAPLLIHERFLFCQRRRKSDEKISDFALDLKRMSSTCQFGDFLDQALCMIFVAGLNHPKAQDRLVQEKTLTYNKAVAIATTMETARTSCAELGKSSGATASSSQDSVNKIHRSFNKSDGKDCWRCGQSGHAPFRCFYKSRKCHKCNQHGHVQARCDSVKQYQKTHKPQETRQEKSSKDSKRKSHKKSGHRVSAVEQDESSEDSDLEVFPMFGISSVSDCVDNIANDSDNMFTVGDFDDEVKCGDNDNAVKCDNVNDKCDDNDNSVKCDNVNDKCDDNDNSVKCDIINDDESHVEDNDVKCDYVHDVKSDVKCNDEIGYAKCDDVENGSDSVYHVSQSLLLCHVDSGAQPYYVSTSVNDVPVQFELDTAAAVSVIGSDLFDKHWERSNLRKPSAVLKGYSGTRLDLAGEFDVRVEYQGQAVKSVLRVIEGNRPALFGRDLLRQIKLDWANIFAVKNDSKLDGILAKFKDVFSDKPGQIKGFEAHIPIDEDAVPRFKKAYSVPFPLQDKVKKQISEAVDKGVYTPVDHSEWASPQVIVVKENGSLRLCGDYKVTVNQVLEKDPYPLPTVEELLAKLNGGSIFTKLDLAEAFQQLALSESSKKLLTVNTIKGLMQYERMPFGIKTAPQVFQKVMDKLLQGIENVVCYIDDILIWSSSAGEHYAILEKVLRRLSDHNVRARLAKCSFLKDSIDYLGHRVDRQGIHPSEGNVQALKNAPVPTDVSELRAFLGLVNYHGKFIKDLSTVVSPLNELLRKDTKWNWSKQCQLAFDRCKQLITSDSCLTPYDVKKPIRLACDASAYGVGVMLTHMMEDGSERPVAMASRSLNQAERNYSQLEKEALSIIFGVKKFHKYIYGKKVEILTDHKPLSTLLGSKAGIPTLAAARLQRWSIILSAYDYDIKYRKGSDHGNADGLSRLPDQSVKPPSSGTVKCITLDDLPVDSGDIQVAISKDPILRKVYDFVLHGWPNDCKDSQNHILGKD